MSVKQKAFGFLQNIQYFELWEIETKWFFFPHKF